jgi:glycerol-3-phosphate dehydrogenase
VDLVVIGGGINGSGIAVDAAGRGLSVLLCEQHDLAAHTSSASSKLVHGGLRYLEQFDFRLVREALGEREVLMAKAPHLIWPLRFVLPHRPHLRPRWMLRAGLFLYDHLHRGITLPRSKALELNGQGILNPVISHAFEYSDCWADDSRLVALNAVQAASLGADIRLAASRRGVVTISGKSTCWALTKSLNG